MAEITDYLKGLEEQDVQVDKRIKVVGSSVLDLICEQYEYWMKKYPMNYQDVYTPLKELNIKSKDVTNFSLVMKKYEKYYWFCESGFFLSALIEASEENKFLIETRHLGEKMNLIGFDTTKDILVMGNVGNRTGQNKRKGTLVIRGNADCRTGDGACTGAKIIVHGNAGFNTGDGLRGGRITVNGSTKFNTGIKMTAGKIIVKGSVGDNTCDEMSGGELRVYGRIWGIGGPYAGKIYNWGKLVWPEYTDIWKI